MREDPRGSRAELAALQSRTNPHFLFNSINTVASLIPEHPVLAERSLERLAEILRFSLASLDQRTVPLGRELEIDVSRVRALVSDDRGQLAELDDGQRARVSRRRVAELRAALGLTEP